MRQSLVSRNLVIIIHSKKANSSDPSSNTTLHKNVKEYEITPKDTLHSLLLTLLLYYLQMGNQTFCSVG